jgi:hypothetical protein
MSRARLAVAVALALAAPSAFAQLEFTAAGAVVAPGSIFVTPYNWDTSVGFSANAGVDYAVAPKFSAGLVVQYSSVNLSELDVGAQTVGAGVSLKVLLGDPKAIHFKVGANLLYQLNSVDVPEADGASGLGVGALVEVLKPMSPTLDLVGQVGFITQPSGGNDSADVTWGPIFFVGVGAAFGG